MKRTTLLLHTRNRPQFLRRAIRYYAAWPELPIVILDGSDDPAPEERLLEGISRRRRESIKLLRGDSRFQARIARGLREVTTPYVALAADDDLYMPGWFSRGADHLDGDPACSVVYGHTLMFALAEYEPYAELTGWEFSRPDPVARWLEHDHPAARLGELGRGPWTTIGWYATQRTAVLRRIVDEACAADFSPDMFERSMNLLQPILGKVTMLDTVYLARQINLAGRPRPTYTEHCAPLERLVEIGVAALVEVSGLDSPAARSVIELALAPEVHQLRFNDWRRRAGVDAIERRWPAVMRLIRTLRARRDRVQSADPLAPDPRFPLPPRTDAITVEIDIIRAACQRPATEVSA